MKVNTNTVVLVPELQMLLYKVFPLFVGPWARAKTIDDYRSLIILDSSVLQWKGTKSGHLDIALIYVFSLCISKRSICRDLTYIKLFVFWG